MSKSREVVLGAFLWILMDRMGTDSIDITEAELDGLPDVDNMHLSKNEDGGLTLERNTTVNRTLQ